MIDAALNQKPILSKGVIALLALLLAGIIALIAYLICRGPSRGRAAGSSRFTTQADADSASAGPDSIALTWAPVDAAQQYNLQYVDPKTDSVTAVEQLPGAVNSYIVSKLTPDTDVCFRLSATANGLTGPRLGEGVCQDRATRPIAKPHAIAHSAGKSDTARQAPRPRLRHRQAV